MSVGLAWRLARRELRGGVRGFRILIACLALGVAAIAAVGSVRVAIEEGLEREGAVILGGDAQMEFTYRFANEDERAFMDRIALDVSEIVDFRSMAVVERGDQTERGLTQVKAVDDVYPIYGAVGLEPEIPLADALEFRDGLPGAVMQQVLIDRMGLAPGDTFRLGTQDFELRASLTLEPDSAGGGFGLGPRTIVLTEALAGSGLLVEGTLFETEYRMRLPEGASLPALQSEATALFRDSGMRWQDSRNGAPGISEFVGRIGAFLVLVGLAGLAVGGVGVSAAVRAYLDRKTTVIATLKSVGAEGRTIFLVYLFQIGVLTVIGVTLGLILGSLVPLMLSPLIQAQLPVPAAFGLHPAPLLEAALYGVLTALVFTLWPLARTEDVRPAALFREASGKGRLLPRPFYLALVGIVLAVLVAVAIGLSEVPTLATWSAIGIVGALIVLVIAAAGVRALARWLARTRLARGRPALRLALGAVGGPGGEATSVVLSLGLGLTVLAAVGQIDSNLRSAIERDLPQVAPSYFFVDIQNSQLDGFLDRAEGDPGVARVDTAPMLRGIITRINGEPAREVAGNHWVLEGDRGVTYSVAPPEGAQITEGAWWPEDYAGPPIINFAEEEGRELGLVIGDRLTVNILGRDIEAEIVNFRIVDFSNAGINFVMTMNPGALAGAPHTHIATVYAEEEAEAPLLRDVATAYPNITAVRVRDAIARVTEALEGLAAATSIGAAATLITGFVVLIGAAAAGERGRVFESAVLKTVGATRARILTSFALRSAILGAAAGIVAIAA
ncbi:MAG: ABC transporter permease, partial [Rubricella sp.]